MKSEGTEIKIKSLQKALQVLELSLIHISEPTRR